MKRDIRKELKILAKEEKKRQKLAVEDVIKHADVVLTTLTGAFSRKLETRTFDLVIIDEAAQALEVACWMALLKVCHQLIMMFIAYQHAFCSTYILFKVIPPFGSQLFTICYSPSIFLMSL